MTDTPSDPQTPEEAIIQHIERRRQDDEFAARRARIGKPCPSAIFGMFGANNIIRCGLVKGHEGRHWFEASWTTGDNE